MVTVVVDVEATCWSDEHAELRKQQREISEIIEIGAVRLVGPELELAGEYQAFVRPIKYPELSEFCRTLTTIQQSDVVDAEAFPSAYREFVSWVNAPMSDVTMISWSTYDQALFARQCAEEGLLNEPRWRHVDLKAEFGRWMFAKENVRRRFKLSEALTRTGISSGGTPHRALDDARNTAELLRYIRGPEQLSERSRVVLRRIVERAPEPTHLGHCRDVVDDVKQWFPRVKHELLRTGLISDCGGGRGFLPTNYATRVFPRVFPE